MISRVEVFYRRVRRIFSRTEWTIRLLRLPKLEKPATSPGLVMVQIDGLSLHQVTRALNKGHMPFLKSLIDKEKYLLHTFYSGLPSNTPAVQAEIFYGIKGCVPAFSFVDRSLGKPIKMFDAAYVEQFEPRLQAQAYGLLTGGSSYSNIYTGGAKESHFCWAQLGLGGVLHAANPLVLPFLFILYLDIFIRVFVLLVIEFFLAIGECVRGTLKGRLFFRELEMIWLRTLVCVLLRELIVAGTCMDIVRGLPIIHMNFLGYDEQAHCRGPSSRFAHWSLQGIDDAIKRIHNVMHQSMDREYDLWVYSDHGQERTTPYLVKYGRTLEQAVEELFKSPTISTPPSSTTHNEVIKKRSGLLKAKQKIAAEEQAKALQDKEAKPHVVVTAMGPLGHIYVPTLLSDEEKKSYAQKLVEELKIPLVMIKTLDQRTLAWTKKGCFTLPDQIAEVFGPGHPFLNEMKEDIMRVCHHPDAGEFVIAGWADGDHAISFPIEYGAHASMGEEETTAFALLPMDAPVKQNGKSYMRPFELRDAAQRFLNQEHIGPRHRFQDKSHNKPLRLMSYNVHGCFGMDGCLSVNRIARTIARHNPDIVALQELDLGRARSKGINQPQQIADILGMHYHFYPVVHKGQEQYGNAIISRYPLKIIKTQPLPQVADKHKYEPRGALWVSVEFQEKIVHIINTHLSIWPQERMLQVKALLGNEWLGHPQCEGPVIVCGDFNAMPSSQVYQEMSARLRDTQTILEGHRPRRTYSGRYPISQIDYIFVSQQFHVKSIVVPRTMLDKIASDHLPLISDLSF